MKSNLAERKKIKANLKKEQEILKQQQKTLWKNRKDFILREQQQHQKTMDFEPSRKKSKSQINKNQSFTMTNLRENPKN